MPSPKIHFNLGLGVRSNPGLGSCSVLWFHNHGFFLFHKSFSTSWILPKRKWTWEKKKNRQRLYFVLLIFLWKHTWSFWLLGEVDYLYTKQFHRCPISRETQLVWVGAWSDEILNQLRARCVATKTTPVASSVPLAPAVPPPWAQTGQFFCCLSISSSLRHHTSIFGDVFCLSQRRRIQLEVCTLRVAPN